MEGGIVLGAIIVRDGKKVKEVPFVGVYPTTQAALDGIRRQFKVRVELRLLPKPWKSGCKEVEIPASMAKDVKWLVIYTLEQFLSWFSGKMIKIEA